MKLVLTTTERKEEFVIMDSENDVEKLEDFKSYMDESDFKIPVEESELLVYFFNTKKEFLLALNYWKRK